MVTPGSSIVSRKSMGGTETCCALSTGSSIHGNSSQQWETSKNGRTCPHGGNASIPEKFKEKLDDLLMGVWKEDAVTGDFQI